MTISLIVLFLLLIGSAFFSAAEVAFLSLTNAKVEAMVKRQLPSSKLIQKLKKQPRRLLVTILIGNNIVNIGASSLATVVMTDLFDSAVVGITTGIMTLLVLVFGEIIPKSYASNHPKRFAIFAVRWLRLFQWVAYPLVIIFDWITERVTGKEMQQRVTEEEIKALAKASSRQGSIEEDEGKMIQRLFTFNDITAEDIMTPRVHVAFIEDTTTIDQATDTIKAHPFTRFPVYHETPDNIIGFVHSRDVLLAHHQDKEDQSITAILRPIVTLAKQMPIDDVMKEFQRRQTHMGIVVDGFGGTEGIATFEDVIEELVGEIADEHDISKNTIKRIDKNRIHVAGETELRDVNDFLNILIPGEELDTMAEIMLDELQKLPRKGQKVVFGDITCTVLEVRKRRIALVEVAKG